MSLISGKRVLLAEDEFLVMAMAEDMLNDLGAIVVGPAATLAEAERLARTEAIDAAVLDVNMRGERVDGLADELIGRGVPVVFATGYGRGYLGREVSAPVLDKPYTQEKLVSALAQALQRT